MMRVKVNTSSSKPGALVQLGVPELWVSVPGQCESHLRSPPIRLQSGRNGRNRYSEEWHPGAAETARNRSRLPVSSPRELSAARASLKSSISQLDRTHKESYGFIYESLLV